MEPLTYVSKEQEEEIFKLHRSGLTQAEISRRTGVTKYHVKRISDPEWFKEYTEKKKSSYVNSTKRLNLKLKSRANSSLYNPIYDPRRDGKIFHQTIDAYLTGDPLPGRSALDQRRQEQSQ